MDVKKLIYLSYKDLKKPIGLPKTFKKLNQIIYSQFQITDYFILISIEGKPNVQLQSNKTNDDQYEQIRKQIKSNTKVEIINIAEEKNQVPNEFFVEFVKNQKVECCNEQNCSLCFGMGSAVFDDKDAEIINELVRKRIQQMLPIIASVIEHRDGTIIQSPKGFLEFEKNRKKLIDCQDYLIESNTSINSTSYKIPRSQKKALSINKSTYSSKILNSLQVTGFANSICMLEIHYKNDGVYDWPDSVCFWSEEGPFEIKQEVKSLKINQTSEASITIQIPQLNQGEYKFLCCFRDKQQQEIEGRIGNPFELVLKLISDEKNFPEKTNIRQLLIKEIEEQLISMGYDKHQFSGKIGDFLENYPKDQQTKEIFFSKCLFD